MSSCGLRPRMIPTGSTTPPAIPKTIGRMVSIKVSSLRPFRSSPTIWDTLAGVAMRSAAIASACSLAAHASAGW